MPLWPLPTGTVRLHNRPTAASDALTDVTTGGSAHTKGSWAQLAAATVDDTDAVVLRLGGHTTSGVASPALLDIGVGAAGSEQVLVENLDLGNHTFRSFLHLPVIIPAGSRVAARVQGARASTAIGVGLDCYGGAAAAGGPPTAGAWATYGAVTAASRGTLVDVPGTADTWSSWTEIATSSADHNWWLALADHGDATVVRAVTTLIQVAAAPDAAAAATCAANGTLIWESIIAGTAAEALDRMTLDTPRWSPVPSGTKLWARAQSSSGTNNDIYVCIYGGS